MYRYKKEKNTIQVSIFTYTVAFSKLKQNNTELYPKIQNGIYFNFFQKYEKHTFHFKMVDLK